MTSQDSIASSTDSSSHDVVSLGRVLVFTSCFTLFRLVLFGTLREENSEDHGYYSD